MKFTELEIVGAYLIELEEFKDERGTFARQFCKEELKKYNIDFDIKQCNLSKNTRKGILRGMHYQAMPYPEIKLVSCMKGRIYDTILDLRKDSKTYLKWIGIELSPENRRMLYIPPEVAHGFQTLEDETYVYYQLGEFFKPEYYKGVRYNDSAFGIDFPIKENIIISEKDKNYQDWEV